MTKKQTNNEYDWGSESTTGFESTNQEDLGIPFLQIVQSLSPEINKKHDDHEAKKIEGAEEGDIINILTREILHKVNEEPVQFIPVYAEKLYPEFRPRGTGGGFVQTHRSPSVLRRCERNDKNKDVLVDEPGRGNEIITTHYIYGYVKNKEGEWNQAIIGMSATQLKNARKFLNMMMAIRINGKTPPMYSHIYNLKTSVEKNSEGAWMGWNMSINRVLTSEDAELISMVREASARFVNANNQIETSKDELEESAF